MNLNWTLVGQSITFLVFAWTCYKFIWPLLIGAMDERTKLISEGIENAEQARRDLEDASTKVDEIMREARTDAQALVEQARTQAAGMIEEAKKDAEDEGERIRESARADVVQETNRARESLRTEVAELALSGAERILESGIDRTQHAELLDKLASEL
ncbi:MAG: F0F1 ATP synthase subunit B [Pseudomonadota bacterium]|nr:F0F1 ATP synthase subunit B [Pseudomonadota bacterium]|tara:strand:- start:284 stop:754 length:471 start_codon:yes stop_codon:yes gene_type:complete